MVVRRQQRAGRLRGHAPGGGALPRGREIAQPLRSDLSLVVDLHDAGGSDELGDTVHYGLVTERVAAVVRENTEDLYSGVEHQVVPGVVVSLKIITEKASTRIARFAFEYARKHGRKKIHAIHKANIMKLTDGLFLECIRKVAAEYPDIQYREMIVDNTAMQLVMNPRQFDLLLLTNLYGDILSDQAAGLVGGLGVVPSANLGRDAALFEAVHGTAPDIAGQGLANPTAIVLSSVMMLEYLHEDEAAGRVREALFGVYREGKHLTHDITGGKATTREFTDAVIAGIRAAEKI